MSEALLRSSRSASVLALVGLWSAGTSGGNAVAAPPESAAQQEVHGEPTSPRIYGGLPVASGEYMDVVGVLVGNTLCSGVALAPRLVLTAAHCLDESPSLSSIRVVFGDSINDPLPGSPIDAIRYELHPDYCGGDCNGDEYDFAFVELAQEVDVSFARIIDEQSVYDQYATTGQPVDILGFGQDQAGDQGVKRIVTVPITSYSMKGTEFGAGGDGKDSCVGDSGGPAFVNLMGGERRLLGILSRGYECGEGGVYGNPFAAACWIRERTGVALASADCSECDCLALHLKLAEDDGCGGCAVQSGPAESDARSTALPRSPADLAALAVLTLLLAGLSSRRSPARSNPRHPAAASAHSARRRAEVCASPQRPIHRLNERDR